MQQHQSTIAVYCKQQIILEMSSEAPMRLNQQMACPAKSLRLKTERDRHQSGNAEQMRLLTLLIERNELGRQHSPVRLLPSSPRYCTFGKRAPRLGLRVPVKPLCERSKNRTMFSALVFPSSSGSVPVSLSKLQERLRGAHLQLHPANKLDDCQQILIKLSSDKCQVLFMYNVIFLSIAGF